MDFSFNVNHVLHRRISLVDSSMKILDNHNSPLHKETCRKSLCEIIDRMGEASAKAQGLSCVITSAQRLLLSDHRLYILKEYSACNFRGSVVGILKVGRKRLFVHDYTGGQHELQPLCVLDFYVHESQQRQGHGKVLFEFMLRVEDVAPHHLAIDRPSPKFLGFLKKHYNLKDVVNQNNNFVIFQAFFRDRKDMGQSNRRRRRGGHEPLETGMADQWMRYEALCSQEQPPHVPPSRPPSSRLANRTPVAGSNPSVPPYAQPPRSGAHPNGHPGPEHAVMLGERRPESGFIGTADQYHASSAGLLRTSANMNNAPSNQSLRSGSLSGAKDYPQGHLSGNVGTRGVALLPSLAPPPVAVAPTRQQSYRLPSEYNYTTGLRRHYSHTRLW